MASRQTGRQAGDRQADRHTDGQAGCPRCKTGEERDGKAGGEAGLGPLVLALTSLTLYMPMVAATSGTLSTSADAKPMAPAMSSALPICLSRKSAMAVSRPAASRLPGAAQRREAG